MAARNDYLTYQRDTSRIIYWVVQTSNAIIKRLTTADTACGDGDGDGDGDGVPKEPNLSGGVTVAGLVALAKLISRHVDSAPPAILGLFQSVIDARTAAHSTFQEFAARNPDPEVLRSNASHKCFIDALAVAFESLGGKAGHLNSETVPRAGNMDTAPAAYTESKDDLDRLLLASLNRFGALDLERPGAVKSEPEPESKHGTRPPTRRKQAKPGKGKKGKRAKKPKEAAAVAEPEPEVEDVPLENYRIIQDKDGIVTDYLIAVYDRVLNMVKLRCKMQEIWRQVAYDGLNTAVAGALSHVAVGMVQHAAAAIFVDFPGHDLFQTVMDTITRGDIDKTQGRFATSLFRLPKHGAGGTACKVVERDMDVKEQFFVHAYRGPRKNVDKEAHLLENVDWSPRGPWGVYRVLFGLQDFASFVTTLAMQKPNTDVRKRILPHHVFQLQCIVDSLAVSRGWSVSPFRGHIVVPPARGFRPRRDVDLFIDRDRNIERISGDIRTAHSSSNRFWSESRRRWGVLRAMAMNS
ncbi:hypothetical protein B0T22DRAFT_490806 [Podospora appendiculata]|uniref:DUF6604 domain-containing protein n=1 Tax=Podospora appendiculata TaxID=314037 RepID=A0AAE0XB59_9PEZI|nr:hypothetical protein B0T22DRAFT_490806 [Podospora appendiculata]